MKTLHSAARPRVLITAGPTREHIDPVRFISNASSGKMGAELAAAFLKNKFRVDVVAGPCAARFPRGSSVARVIGARQMLSKVIKLIRKSDIFVAAAAVADYSPAKPVSAKIKKRNAPSTLRLVPAPDILKTVGAVKFDGGRRPVIVGFALESRGRLLADARRKLKLKKCDIVAANSTDAPASPRASGFFVFGPDGRAEAFKNLAKKDIARRIAKEAVKLWTKRNLS